MNIEKITNELDLMRKVMRPSDYDSYFKSYLKNELLKFKYTKSNRQSVETEEGPSDVIVEIEKPKDKTPLWVRLKRVYEAGTMTQQDIADKIGARQTDVSAYVRGKVGGGKKIPQELKSIIRSFCESHGQ